MATKNITDIQVLKAYEKSKGPLAQWSYQILSQETGWPEKVCFRAMERACRHGLIDCGVSLRSGWITEKGLQLLKDNE